MSGSSRQEAIYPFTFASTQADQDRMMTFHCALDSNLQAHYGSLFGFCFVSEASPESHTVMNRLIDSIQNYYVKQVRLSQTQSLTNNVEQLFEYALSQTNKEIQEFRFDRPYKDVVDSMVACVGLLRGEDLIMSTMGKVNGYLIRDTKPVVKHAGDRKRETQDGYDEQRYKIVSVIEEDPSAKAGGFSSLITGDIRLDDRLFFCLPNFLRYLPLDTIKEQLVLLPSQSAAEQFKQYFSSATNEPLVGIVVDPGRQPMSKTPRSLAQGTHESMHHLQNTASHTKQVLFPSFSVNSLPQFIKYLGSWFSAPDHKTPQSHEATRINLSHEVHQVSSKARPKRQFSWKQALSPFMYLSSKASQLFRSSQDKPSLMSGFGYVLKQKYVWLMMAILVMVFLSINLFQTKDDVTVAQEQNFDAPLAQLEQDLNVVSSRLIYGDEEQARTLLAAAKAQIDLLPSDQLHEDERFSNVQTQYQRLFDRVNHQVTVTGPELTVNFQEGFPQQNMNLASTVLVGNTLYAFSCHDVYAFDLDGVSSPENVLSDPNYCVKLAKPHDGDILLLGTDNSFARYDVSTDEIVSLTADVANNESIVDFATFGSSLYSIDHNENKIYKYRIGETALLNKQSWLKKDYQLGLSVGLTIDGSIYILSSNGGLDRYYLGNKKSDFVFKNSITPAISYPQRVVTQDNEEYPYVFILEPQQQRVILINKEDASFVAQYVFPDLEQLQDIAIDFETQTLYLLSENKIHTYKLPE